MIGLFSRQNHIHFLNKRNLLRVTASRMTAYVMIIKPMCSLTKAIRYLIQIIT